MQELSFWLEHSPERRRPGMLRRFCEKTVTKNGDLFTCFRIPFGVWNAKGPPLESGLAGAGRRSANRFFYDPLQMRRHGDALVEV